MEIIQTIVLIIIAYEGVWIMGKIGNQEQEEKVERTSRREVNGTFKNPLGYRTNTKGQFVPIHPGAKMLDGSDDDEV